MTNEEIMELFVKIYGTKLVSCEAFDQLVKYTRAVEKAAIEKFVNGGCKK